MTIFLFAFFVIYLELLGQAALYAIGVCCCWLGIVAIERFLRRARARLAIHRSRTRGDWLIIRDRRRRPTSSSTRNTSTDR